MRLGSMGTLPAHRAGAPRPGSGALPRGPRACPSEAVAESTAWKAQPSARGAGGRTPALSNRNCFLSS